MKKISLWIVLVAVITVAASIARFGVTTATNNGNTVTDNVASSGSQDDVRVAANAAASSLRPSGDSLVSQPVPGWDDAAFRDGLYQGKHDANEGRAVHITSGRWSDAQDRASFTKAYSQAYDTELALRGGSTRQVGQAAAFPNR